MIGVWLKPLIRKLQKFLDLSAPDRRLLWKAILSLSAVRIGLWILPFARVRRWLANIGGASASTSKFSPERLAWAVDVAANVVPAGGHCLTQALTLQLLMHQNGYSCEVCFGIHPGSIGVVAAHAWLEHDGRVLIGGGELDTLVRLSAPKDASN